MSEHQVPFTSKLGQLAMTILNLMTCRKDKKSQGKRLHKMEWVHSRPIFREKYRITKVFSRRLMINNNTRTTTTVRGEEWKIITCQRYRHSTSSWKITRSLKPKTGLNHQLPQIFQDRFPVIMELKSSEVEEAVGSQIQIAPQQSNEKWLVPIINRM